MIFRCLLIILLLISTACSTTGQGQFFTPAVAEDEHALVYIYRPFVMANAAYKPDLYINNELRKIPGNGKNIALPLPPGVNSFEIEPDSQYTGNTKISFELTAGNVYYLRIASSLKLNSALTYQPYQREFSIIRTDPKTAIDEIAGCCVIHDLKKLENKDSGTIVDSDDSANNDADASEGFSVDKTQNPFSH